MKKIAVVAANGRVARKVITEAVNRGMSVKAFGQHENNTDAKEYEIKDIMSVTKADFADCDTVVDAFGIWDPEKMGLHTTTLMHLCDTLSGTDKRLVIVGGAGSLFVNKEHTQTLFDTPDFPEDYKLVAKGMMDALGKLRERKDVRWTYISPAYDFQADGERSGEYMLAGEEFTRNSKGESVISYADFAIAMVDEIESGNHIQERVSVLRK